MRNNLEIALKISSDLMSYCHHHGATDYETKVSEGDEAIMYMIQAHPVKISAGQLAKITKKIKTPR